MRTLVHERLVVFDSTTKTYRLGLGLIELAHGALDQRLPLLVGALGRCFVAQLDAAACRALERAG